MLTCCRFAALFFLFACLPCIHTQAEPGAEVTGQEDRTSAPARRPRMPAEIIFESSLGDVVFPHKVHRRMGCPKCHHQLRAKELDTPHDDYLDYSWVNCRSCHDESQARSAYYGCNECHHSNLQNIADETLSTKVVLHKNCWKCHLSGTGAEASERCSFCHVKDQPPLNTSE